MDDRGYLAQALLERLSGEGIALRVLGDHRGYPEQVPLEVQIAVPRSALAGVPRALGRFCQALDLQMVQLAPCDSRAWRCTLAWRDEVGRPRFMGLRACSDYCRGARRYLRAEELLAGMPDALFAHALADAVEDLALAPERAAWLRALWQEDPRGAIERIARFFPSRRNRANVRLVAQAAKHGAWEPMRARLPELRRALRRAVLPEPADMLARLAVLARNLAQPGRAAVVFMGRESAVRTAVMHEVARDLAPLGLTFFEAGPHAARAALRVVFDGHAEPQRADIVAVRSDREPATLVVELERAILRWLECRVERSYPDALVGENPPAARLLQFALRHRIPGVQLVLNCDIRCALGPPVLMPYPYGIVIERGARIGSRVTLMHQVSLLGAPVLEDNVTVGPGAKIVGPVRIGRGATIGPNAVVTGDVPSHDTVVVEKRPQDRRSVVNV